MRIPDHEIVLSTKQVEPASAAEKSLIKAEPVESEHDVASLSILAGNLEAGSGSRETRIEALRASVARGEYAVSPLEIAGKILAEHIKDQTKK